MGKFVLLLIFIFALFFVVIPVDVVSAQGLVPCDDDCNVCHLVTLADNIVDWLVVFAAIIATLMFVYAGVLYVTAAANPEQISRAHKVFWSVFIGIIVVLIAWLVVELILTTFTGGGLDFWNPVSC